MLPISQHYETNYTYFGARYYDSDLSSWLSVDPLAAARPNLSPYNYCQNNPVVRIDPTGLLDGEFVNENGKVIGNDGINDGRVYVLRNEVLSYKELKETKKFIKNNSGNTEVFENDNIAYKNSIEIVGSTEVRQSMMNIVTQDNGRGGTTDANNREYGGYIEDGVVTEMPAGNIGNPKTISPSIELPLGKDTFHSHPSGTIVESPPIGTIGEVNTTPYEQFPSDEDIQNAGNTTRYVFGMNNQDRQVYIYNSKGTQAKFPMNKFVNLK